MASAAVGGRDAQRGGLGRRQHQGEPGAAGTLVASEGSAAARSLAAQLQRGLVKKNIRVVWHGCLPDTTFALSRKTSKSKAVINQSLTDRMPSFPGRFLRYSHRT